MQAKKHWVENKLKAWSKVLESERLSISNKREKMISKKNKIL
jgi:hypothetical protein